MSLILSGTDGLSDVDGSASTPAIRGTDTNTGIFFPAADTIAFAEGGAEVARFDSSGNLGIGTTSPARKLDVVENGTAGVIQLTSYRAAAGQSAFSTRFARGSLASPAIIQSGDTIGVWDSYPYNGTNFNLQTAQIQTLVTGTVTSSSIPTAITFSTDAAGLAYANERMRIDSNGDLLVGTTTVVSGTSTDRSGIVVKGTIGTRASMKVCANNDTATFALIIFANDTDGQIGSVTQNSNGTVNYNTNSDYRLKQNIVSMTGALDKVSQLKPCIGNWKKNNAPFQGFIAHELQEIVPECVTGEKDAIDEEGKPIYQGVDTSFLVATLTAAIQEQQAIINDLKTRIEALENT
jgi:hypothetical protein